MLAFGYKKIFLIFTFFSNPRATSKKGDWDQLYCYRFTGTQKESCVVRYVYICPEYRKIF